MGYISKNNEVIVINESIQGDPLSEENLDKSLELVNKTRLLLPEKTIWLYTGYTWEEIFTYEDMANEDDEEIKFFSDFIEDLNMSMRKDLIKLCDVIVDGRYIDSQRDITLAWCGSSNQRVIDILKSLQEGEIVLWTN